MESLYVLILVGTILIVIAAFSSLLAFRFGAPLLLLFLSIGLVAGVDGIGIDFDNADLAYFVGTIALAVILFDSGFGTRISTFKQAAAPALLLATVGVLITAVLFGIAASYLLHVPLVEGLLLGAIIGSTDAAAVFFLLRVGGITVRERVRSLLEIESGTNDPMAIFLSVALVEMIRAGGGIETVGLSVMLGLVSQMLIGLLGGFLGGMLISAVVRRLKIDRGLLPIITLSLALCIFSAVGTLGGSGFLAVYVAGLYAGNARLSNTASIKRFQDGLTWLAQIVMFLILGLLATPSQFAEIAWQALALAAFLIFVARPLAVWLCLIPFDFQRREMAFVSWVGLRGAVSILLAIVPLIGGLDDYRLFFNSAFIIVLASLLVQGWTIASVARRLGLVVPPRTGAIEKFELELPGTPDHELLSYRVVSGSPVARGERVPRWARPSLVIREGQSMRYQYAGRLRAGDYVFLFISPRYPPLLDRLFARPAELDPDDAEFFGEFSVDPAAKAAELAKIYGFRLQPGEEELSISDLMIGRLGGEAEYGDRVSAAPIELIVRQTGLDGAVVAAGLSLEPESGRGSAIPLFFSRKDLTTLIKEIFARPRKKP
ncbi:potassium/proton antiporter [Jiella sp. MQZ9-1]|uniref:Potassium/proton antiporter n=1 Tax=Jiella flava TaxID=2816857 RepID=A0A939G063_9HYPH|nr:potassium/proton antiporter [Jiella flava]MBO0663178.1 potassium/proton antiporter [Jiella flava]MCD2471596.1 potassium/proton antiporter [Jiella flava]